MTSPSPASPARIELPEEIDRAIEDLEYAVDTYAREGHPQFRTEMDDKRSALTAAILSRLSAAEAGREEAEKERDLWKRQYGLSVNRAFDAIEERDRAEASIGRAQHALDEACRMSAILLMAGEMSPQERRTAQAVANGLAAKVRSALSDPSHPALNETTEGDQ